MRIKEFITICLLLVSVSLFAQEKTIEVTGVVTDMNKEPLVGVNVTVKDKPGLGAITDINGRYKINIEEFSRLVFSYIGFDTQEILVKHQNLVNVSMKESEAREIDEVVITGTGAQKKLTVTGIKWLKKIFLSGMVQMGFTLDLIATLLTVVLNSILRQLKKL